MTRNQEADLMAPLSSEVVPFARDLARFGDRIAVVTAGDQLTYLDLAARVEAVAGRLGATRLGATRLGATRLGATRLGATRLGAARRLVLLAGANTVDALTAYLAALAGGHPVLLAPADRPEAVDALIAGYDPDVVVRDGGRIDQRREASRHSLHPDLALLLSTSGSTGSAKLVRLSLRNLQANAESIAEYLDIRPDDRAATTLPMHYCYGLSVVNSHLLRGAALLLTDRSVTDPEFWASFSGQGGTSFAGVPYTFDLLDRVGFDGMDLPHLRYVTQAGGRLAPDRVRRYAELGRRKGWDFVVMYGQTEATARIAYLPAELAADHPQCIGVPIPGGSLRLEPQPDWPEPDTGELVYAGPNVMLGYADTAADLRLGRTVEELHTGDIARRTPEGLFEIVGRRSRFAKLFGLRIDLQRVEAELERHGVTACCLSDGDRLAVVAEASGDGAGRIRRLAARACGLPVRAVGVHAVAGLPRLANGKPDHPAIRALIRHAAERAKARGAAADPSLTAAGPTDLVALYAEVLDRPDATADSTFVSLGGDSLSYVEVSVRLEQILGHLPANWHTTPIRELRPAGRRAKRTATLDTSVALRAVAIVLIVSTHAAFFNVSGGAHLLLAVAGFNFARFHLSRAGRGDRVRGIARSAGRIALASMCWIGLAALFLTDDYLPAQIFLVNNILGPPGRFNDFWFIEAVVYMMLAMLALVAIPRGDSAERRLPFALPMALMAIGLITRYQLIPGVKLATPLAAFWLFALGWAAAKASTWRQRGLVTFAAVVTIPGFHGDLKREAVMVTGLVVLAWIPTLPSLPWINRVAGVLATASLYIYLTHNQVLARLDPPWLAVAAALAVGIGYATVAGRTAASLSRTYGRLRTWTGRRVDRRGHRMRPRLGTDARLDSGVG
jgi:acyl-CoA synthetase (AMP-forming)/AMP-acid ligase II